MNTDIQIRKLTLEDSKQVFRLLNELYKGMVSYDYFSENYPLALEDVRNYYIGAVIDDEVVGILVATELPPKLRDTKKRIFVDTLIVDNEYRNHGVGKKILETLANYAKENHYDIIELTSLIENKNAHRFYEHNNFQKTAYKFKFEI